jgi:hypothetical protein
MALDGKLVGSVLVGAAGASLLISFFEDAKWQRIIDTYPRRYG